VTLPVFVRPVAEQDLLEAQRWYDGQRSGLGAEFRQAVDLVLQKLGESPLIHPVAYRGIRRAAVRRFPYLVYYSVRADRIEVIGCLHSRRDPKLLRMRAR
jgi:plasmid stabilization system protein ParE